MRTKFPWGEYTITRPIDGIRCARDQLQYYLDNEISPDRQFTIADVAGYELLLQKNSDDLVLKFYELKQQQKSEGKFQNNHVTAQLLIGNAN